MDVIYRDNPIFFQYWEKIGQSRIEGVLFSQSNIEYSIEYSRESMFHDLSMIIVEDDCPVLAVIISLEINPKKERILNGFGRPIRYIESNDVDTSSLKRAHKLFRNLFNSILEEHKPEMIVYQDYLCNGNLSFLGRSLMSMGATSTPYFSQIINISQPEKVLRQQLRRSYKSLINWGDKNLNVHLLDSKTITEEDMEAFRRLHIKVSGQETRSVDTWKIQYEIIIEGGGFAVFGYLGAELVTTAFFIHNSICCYFGVSASIRELFDKPLSHIILWKAIIHSKELGCSVFEVGEQLFCKQGSPTNKELGISLFKRGFGGETQVRLNIRAENIEF
jgi:hypothetical protein